MSFDMNPADEDPHGECRHEIHQLESELAQWRQFAAYCRSCALSGECDPHSFEKFIEYRRSTAK